MISATCRHKKPGFHGNMSEPQQSANSASNIIYLHVGLVYLVVVCSVALMQQFSPGANLTFIGTSLIAWAVIGWCQFALFNALHEGLHRRFGNPHRELLGNVLTAYPVGFDESYRRLHLDHHKFFGTAEQDPDFAGYSPFPTTRRQFLLRLFLNLCGWYTLLQFLGVRQSRSSNTQGKRPTTTMRLVLVQLLILLAFEFSVGWFYYLWLWLLPLVTFGKFYSSTRTFCEHAAPDNAPTIRTITGSLIGEKILGIFSFHYHAEHHEYVAVPYHRLRASHRQHKAELYDSPAQGPVRLEHYSDGYINLLVRWYKELP